MKSQKKKISNLKPFGKIALVILAVIIVGYCVFYMISNFASVGVLKSQKQDLDTKYSQQVKENEKIKDILESDNKDDYIEEKAREKGYVKDGEVVYYDISSSK